MSAKPSWLFFGFFLFLHLPKGLENAQNPIVNTDVRSRQMYFSSAR